MGLCTWVADILSAEPFLQPQVWASYMKTNGREREHSPGRSKGPQLTEGIWIAAVQWNK